MNPQPSFCPNLACSSRGKVGAGNLRVHDRLRDRWKCRTCGKTFSARTGTPFFGLKSDPQMVVLVVTLLAFSCPLPAIVAAFGLDERTVAAWQRRAGAHCQAVHESVVQTPHAPPFRASRRDVRPVAKAGNRLACDGDVCQNPSLAWSRGGQEARHSTSQATRPPGEDVCRKHASARGDRRLEGVPRGVSQNLSRV